MKAKGVIRFVLSLGLAAVLVWFALRGVDWNEFLAGLRLTRWVWLVPFMAASVGALVFRMLRWNSLLESSGCDTRKLLIWDANNVGNLANIVIPGSGEFIRCGYVAGKKNYGSVFGTIVVERIWDFIAVLVIVVLAVVLDNSKFGPFFQEQIWTPLESRLSFSLWWILLLLTLLAAAFFWAVFRFRGRNTFFARIFDSLSSVGSGLASFRKLGRKWLFLLYTVGIWSMYVIMCFSVQKAVPALAGLGLEDALFFTAVGNIATVIPVPGGIGAYHYLLAFSVSSIYGGSWETGILFATLQHELHAVLILVLGIVSYFRLALRKRA